MHVQPRVLPSILALTVLAAVHPSAPASEVQIIEEVTVTAQKREESAQDIGITIAAITGDQLRELGIDQAQDLFEVMSNVSLQNIGGGGVPVVIVRGIGLQNFRINDSPTTAFYVDEVYQTSVASVEWTMFDLQRVEMLKGPQGGLYGRNALGGAVQVVSNAPEPGAPGNGYLQVGYREYSRAEVEGAVELGLGDTAGLRLAGRWVESDDAPYEDVTLGTSRGEEDRYALRGTLRIQPGDATDITIKLHGGEDNSQLPPLRPMGIYANIGTGAALGAPGVSLGFLNGVLGLGLGDPLCESVRSGRGMDPANCADISGRTPASYGITGDVHAGPSGFDAIQESSWQGASANIRFSFGDYTLQSITAYDSIDYRRFIDFDGTPLEHQHIDYTTEIDAFSQEFRLFFDGSDTLRWMLGASYGSDDLGESSILYGANGILPLFFGGATFSPQSYDQETTALAVYGRGEWRLSEAVNLVGELRYTDAEKTFVGGSMLGFPGGATVPFVGTDDKADFKAPSGKIGIEYTANEQVLLFGNISRGFKTGGFFGGFPTSADQLAPFDEETVLAYEAGFKSDLAAGRLRLNGSVYYYDRSDVQQNAADPNSVVAIKRIANIGDVRTYGAELDLAWLPTDKLLVQLGIGATDSEVTESNFVQSSSLPLLPDSPVEGTNTPNYAKLSANFAVRYEDSYGDKLRWFVQADGRYQSEMDLSVITNPIEEAVFQEPGYAVLNLRAGLGPASDRWQLLIFVENLTDEEYRIDVRNDGTFGVYELFGTPRTWGLRYIYRWGE